MLRRPPSRPTNNFSRAPRTRPLPVRVASVPRDIYILATEFSIDRLPSGGGDRDLGLPARRRSGGGWKYATPRALANFHFTQNRVDHGSMDRGGLRNALTMARLHTMATGHL